MAHHLSSVSVFLEEHAHADAEMCGDGPSVFSRRRAAFIFLACQSTLARVFYLFFMGGHAYTQTHGREKLLCLRAEPNIQNSKLFSERCLPLRLL